MQQPRSSHERLDAERDHLLLKVLTPVLLKWIKGFARRFPEDDGLGAMAVLTSTLPVLLEHTVDRWTKGKHTAELEYIRKTWAKEVAQVLEDHANRN